MSAIAAASARAAVRPRLGFLGLGWIGTHRLRALARARVADVAAVADPDAGAREAARGALDATAGEVAAAASLDELLEAGVDGIVIATPSALHAEQAIRALERGLAVFCQKPLGRTGPETRRVVDAARAADRLLGLDLSYRYTRAVQAVRELVTRDALGTVYAIDLVFHNAYGPDKPWFYDPRLSGGGAVVDLGIHLVDLALWALDFPAVQAVHSRLYAGGRRIVPGADTAEDYAVAQLDLSTGAVVRLACSWRLPAGQDAVIEAAFFGTAGGAAVRNVEGSFYDFVAERFHGTAREALAAPPDEWGGRALVDWARRLGAGHGFDPAAERWVEVAEVLDRIYGRS